MSLLNLEEVIDYSTFLSVSQKKSKWIDPFGMNVFQVPVRPGFYLHLLALGPELATRLLSRKIVHLVHSDQGEQEIYEPDGQRTQYNEEIHNRAWSLSNFVLMHPWQGEYPCGPDIKSQKTKRFQNSPLRLSMKLPGVRTRKEFFNDVYGTENISAKRYVFSPRTLTFFLEFGIVTHPVPVLNTEDAKYDINPYNMAPSKFGNIGSEEKIYDADKNEWVWDQARP